MENKYLFNWFEVTVYRAFAHKLVRTAFWKVGKKWALHILTKQLAICNNKIKLKQSWGIKNESEKPIKIKNKMNPAGFEPKMSVWQRLTITARPASYSGLIGQSPFIPHSAEWNRPIVCILAGFSPVYETDHTSLRTSVRFDHHRKAGQWIKL